MKRMVAFMLALLIVLAAPSLSMIAASPNGSLTAANLSTKAGDTFSVALYLSDNSSLNAFRLFVDFDDTVLSFDGVEDGVLAEGIEAAPVLDGESVRTDRVALIWNDAEAFAGDGLLCRLSFTMLSSVQAGTQTTVTVSGDTEEGWCLDGELAPYIFSPVTLTVLAAYPCDITFDENGVTTDIAIGSNVSEVVSEMESGGYTDVTVLDASGNEKEWDALIGTGDRISVGEHTFYISVSGDLNGDGSQSVTDYIIMRTEILSPGTLSGVYLTAADINGDGGVSVTDYVILRAILLAQ